MAKTDADYTTNSKNKIKPANPETPELTFV